jgi:hypothetical protein
MVPAPTDLLGNFQNGRIICLLPSHYWRKSLQDHALLVAESRDVFVLGIELK